MSIFNPWGELRALKARLANEEQAYLVEEAEQQRVWAEKEVMLMKLIDENAKLQDTVKRLDAVIADFRANLYTRDPKTGRFTKKAK